jgi:glycosyltransferase involved in cell wall biosynthesis
MSEEPQSLTNTTAAPIVSVVIPCRDDKVISGTLDSLVGQSGGEYEVVVVDASGTDLSRRLSPWRDRMDLRVVEGAPGAYAGDHRNRGVLASRGNLLLFVDADDIVGEGYIVAMKEALQYHELVCSRVDIERLNPWNVGGSHPQEAGLIESEMHFLPFAGAGTIGIHRSLFEEMGGFDRFLRCYEEADLCWRLQLAGYEPPAFVRDAVLHYRLEPERRKRWKKALAFGAVESQLYRRYRQVGMPRESVREAIADWFGLLRRFMNALMGSDEPGIAWQSGVRLGRLCGSLRNGVPYF